MLKLLVTLFFITTLNAGVGISLADNYQKNSGLQWDWAMDSLEYFSFNQDDKVLDVGSGDGKITALIANTVSSGSVVGLDISESMVERANGQFNLNNLEFIQGSATSIPYQNQFDKVVSFCTLHWVLDQLKALVTMRDALVENGVLLIVTPGKANNNLATLAESVAKSEKWSPYFSDFKQERVYFTLEEYRQLLQEANLTTLSLKESLNITLYKDKEALINWIKPLVNFADHLTPDQKSLFIEDIADQMILNDPPLPDGSLPVKHLKIEAIATKG